MMFRVNQRGQKNLVRIKRFDRLTQQGIRQGFFDTGKDLKHDTSQQILHKPKSGRVYIRRIKGGRRRRHVASAPGETIANLTGSARRSLGWVVRGSSQLEFGFGVTRDAPDHVVFTEFGTRKMAPRQSIQNTVRRNLRNAEVNLAQHIIQQFQ